MNPIHEQLHPQFLHGSLSGGPGGDVPMVIPPLPWDLWKMFSLIASKEQGYVVLSLFLVVGNVLATKH